LADRRGVSYRSSFERFSWRERAKALEKLRFWQIKSDWFRSIWRNFQPYLADDARTPREKDRWARNRRDPKIHVGGPVDPEGRSVGLEKRSAAVEITGDDGATTDFSARRCDVSNPRDWPDSPIQAWVSPALTGPRPGSPPIKPEGGREKTTAGFAVRSLNRSDTRGVAGLSNHVR
jgi:hypothetical protein